MEHRPSPPLVAVHQRVCRTGGLVEDAEPSRDGLDEGGLPGPELAFEGHQRPRREGASHGLALGLELGEGECANHGWRRSLGWPPRRTSGAAMALRTLSWARSTVASSNS